MEIFLVILAAPVAVFLCAAVIGCVLCLARADQTKAPAPNRHRLGEYLLNLLIAFDQLVNTLCGGSPDETISSACYRFGARLPPKSLGWRLVYRGVNLLFFWQKDHCRGAYNSERERKHLPESLQVKGEDNAEQHPA